MSVIATVLAILRGPEPAKSVDQELHDELAGITRRILGGKDALEAYVARAGQRIAHHQEQRDLHQAHATGHARAVARAETLAANIEKLLTERL